MNAFLIMKVIIKCQPESNKHSSMNKAAHHIKASKQKTNNQNKVIKLFPQMGKTLSSTLDSAMSSTQKAKRELSYIVQK